MNWTVGEFFLKKKYLKNSDSNYYDDYYQIFFFFSTEWNDNVSDGSFLKRRLEHARNIDVESPRSLGSSWSVFWNEKKNK